MFRKADNTGYTTLMPGIQMKTLVYGNKTLLAEFVLQKGNILTEHTHSHEQTGYLVTGHIRLKIGEIIHETLPGDSWCIPSDIKWCPNYRRFDRCGSIFSVTRRFSAGK